MCFYIHRQILKSFASFILIICGCMCLLLTLGNTALANRTLKETLSSIQTKALQGDSYYQGILALCYKYGEKGLPIQINEAERWAKVATKNNGGIGMATLASIQLEKGNNERSQFLYDEAYLHSNLRDLSKSKDPYALFCIGLMEIDNPPKNPKRGIRNIESSAKIGFSTAQATLGVIFLTGAGTDRNLKDGIRWTSLAAKQKHPLAMFYLGMAYSFGDGVPKNEDYANRWIRAAADKEFISAQLTLGMRLAMGEGIERNLQRGVTWLRRAEDKGSSEAKIQLRRFETLLQANQRNPVSSNSPKGDFTQPPVHLAKNTEDATTEVSRKIGLKNYKKKNYQLAKIHFLNASEQKDPLSLRYLGIMNFLGQGFAKNNDVARAWLNKAVKAGDSEAQRYLEVMRKISD